MATINSRGAMAFPLAQYYINIRFNVRFWNDSYLTGRYYSAASVPKHCPEHIVSDTDAVSVMSCYVMPCPCCMLSLSASRSAFRQHRWRGGASTHLGRVKEDALGAETRVAAHVVDVELEIATVHNGQHQTQGVFGFVRVRQTNLQ